MKELAENWEYFLNENKIPNTVRPAIYQSWLRCQNYDVNPLQQQTSVMLSHDQLNEILHDSKLFHVAKPVIEKLYQQIKGTDHLITLSDHKGRIIHLKGERSILQQAEKMNFVLGADWSERVAGSNAIGTSLAAKQPVQIFSYEHFCEGVHPWVCSAAPIYDPISQNILGVIDLTGPSELAQSHSLSVVQSISSIIEQQLLGNSSPIIHQLQSEYENVKSRQSTINCIVLDAHLNIINGDQNSLSMLKLNAWKELWQNEELQDLKVSLHTNTQPEWEWSILSRNVKAFIRSVIRNNERIGYVICFEKLYQFNPKDPNNKTVWKGIISQSPVMKKLIDKIKIVAPKNVPVLITGESGTGKELISYAVHQKSDRAQKPYITINCGAIPQHLIASELFGYEPGAFTGGDPKGKKGKFEEANGGTLLLDEIGEMPFDLQVHLLRVLQEKEIVRLGSAKPIPIDVRIIAATNKNLNQLISLEKFRSDLYFRLNIVEITLPPLRDRKKDITLLCQHFVTELAKTHQKAIPTISPEVIKIFEQYRWEGNVRELRNVMEYAVLFSENDIISVHTLPKTFQAKSLQTNPEHQLSLVEKNEKEQLITLIAETNGNLSEVARICGFARSTLYRKLAKYQLATKK